MDDPAAYGPEFHRLPFSRAVTQDLLADYKLVVLAISERHRPFVKQHCCIDYLLVNNKYRQDSIFPPPRCKSAGLFRRTRPG